MGRGGERRGGARSGDARPGRCSGERGGGWPGGFAHPRPAAHRAGGSAAVGASVRSPERPSALGQERFPPGHGDLQRAAVTDTVSETLLFENKCGQLNIPEYYT